MRHPMEILKDLRQYIPAGRADLLAEVDEMIAGSRRGGARHDPHGLTPTERIIFDLARESAPLAVSRDRLVEALSTEDREASREALWVHKRRLNQKLAKRGLGVLAAVIGYGYVYYPEGVPK